MPSPTANFQSQSWLFLAIQKKYFILQNVTAFLPDLFFQNLAPDGSRSDGRLKADMLLPSLPWNKKIFFFTKNRKYFFTLDLELIYSQIIKYTLAVLR